MKYLIKAWTFLYGKKTYIGAILYLLGKYGTSGSLSALLIEIAGLIMGVGVVDMARREGTKQVKLFKLRRLHHD